MVALVLVAATLLKKTKHKTSYTGTNSKNEFYLSNGYLSCQVLCFSEDNIGKTFMLYSPTVSEEII
jgi:hypothetical protein